MHGVVRDVRRGNGRRGFTLVELLVVVVVLAVLAAIVLPKFVGAGARSRESALKSDLKLLRNAVSLFYTDTGYYPATLADLAATSAPAKGLDSAGTLQNINSADWHGPYIQELPKDPVNGADFSYGTVAPDVGKVSSTAPGYTTW